VDDNLDRTMVVIVTLAKKLKALSLGAAMMDVSIHIRGSRNFKVVFEISRQDKLPWMASSSQIFRPF